MTRMLGIPLWVEGEVVQRDPPVRKAWETVGEPHLLVIGRYRMSANIEARGDRSHVTIAIDYDWPAKAPARWLGMLFGPMYARWCVRQMIQDLVREFSGTAGVKSAMHQDRSSE